MFEVKIEDYNQEMTVFWIIKLIRYASLDYIKYNI